MQKRRWFQIHLSTAIVLMFVASVLLWANMRGHLAEIKPYEIYGWPCDAAWEIKTYWKEVVDNRFPTAGWEPTGLAINIGVALAVLSVVAVGFEWLIRRRDAVRRPETLQASSEV